MAARANSGFVIGLTYGPGTDWCRNVLASGHGTLVYDGAEYPLVAPEVVPSSEALPFFKPAVRRVARLVGLREFLHAAVEQPPKPL